MTPNVVVGGMIGLLVTLLVQSSMIGVMIRALVTILVQASSTSTSIIVGQIKN
jgi:Na+/phosphate symporter